LNILPDNTNKSSYCNYSFLVFRKIGHDMVRA